MSHRSGTIGYEDDAAPAASATTLVSNALCPEPGDNSAILVKTVHQGETIVLNGKVLCASAPLTVLEGHRVACALIPKGGSLTSWGTSFGIANVDLQPGDYCCNQKVLKVLKVRRSITWDLPPAPTFEDLLLPKTVLDQSTYVTGTPTPLPPAGATPVTFNGFVRPGNLGTGTRNYVVIMAVTSEASSFTRALESISRSAG